MDKIINVAQYGFEEYKRVTGGMIDVFGDISDECKYIINNVIQEYGALESWKLSELSHKELSWQNARIGLHEGENGSKKLKLEDIREDAKKVRPYDYV